MIRDRFLVLVACGVILAAGACGSPAGDGEVEEATVTVRPIDTATIRPTEVVLPTDEPTREPVRVATVALETATAEVLPTSTIAPAATDVPATAVPPTDVLPTAIPPTAEPPTAVPATEIPAQPTATLPPAAGELIIIGVDKSAEVVTIRNDGGADVDLAGWVLRSERGSQDCALGGVVGPGQVLQIWAMAEDAGMGGFNCGFDSNIWNNDDPDAAMLIDASGVVVSQW